MEVITIKNADVSSIKLVNPESSKGNLFCEISNKSHGCFVQTPKLHYKKISDESLELKFSNEKNTDSISSFYNLIQDIETKICTLLFENSEEWFSDSIPYETIRNNLFKSVLRLPERFEDSINFSVNIPKNIDGSLDIEIFDTNENKHSFDEVFNTSDVKEITTLLHVKELIINSNQAYIVWEVVQILIHKKKKKIKGFGIRKETIEETPEKLKIELQPEVIKKIDEEIEGNSVL